MTDSGPPDRTEAQQKYRRLAPSYDTRLGSARRLQGRAVTRLAPGPGETVIDVGCGTGLSFQYLEQSVGPKGRILGVELSAEMVRQAELRAQSEGWDNVTLLHASAEDAQLPRGADAALFVLTHDVTRSHEALENVLAAVKSGGRIVAAGSKRPPWWTGPLRAYVRLKARRYVTTFEGFDQPWTLLAELVPDSSLAESVIRLPPM